METVVEKDAVASKFSMIGVETVNSVPLVNSTPEECSQDLVVDVEYLAINLVDCVSPLESVASQVPLPTTIGVA